MRCGPRGGRDTVRRCLHCNVQSAEGKNGGNETRGGTSVLLEGFWELYEVVLNFYFSFTNWSNWSRPYFSLTTDEEVEGEPIEERVVGVSVSV